MPDPSPIVRAVQELNFLGTVLKGGQITQPSANTKHALTGLTILSGFLGAGKTTLLQRILAGDHGKRIAVIVNDFGGISIDAAMISEEHGDVVELTNGCSCCAMGSDFVAALEQVLHVSEPPDHVMVEASGLSDPAALATLAAGVVECDSIGIVTLVDALTATALEQLEIGHIFTRQMDVAHLIVLTKTSDLKQDQRRELQDQLGTRFPGRQILTDTKLNLATTFCAETQGARLNPQEMQHDLSGVNAYQLPGLRQWKFDQLTQHLEQMPAGILRLKGSAMLENNQFAHIQCVGKQFDISRKSAQPARAGLVLIGLRDQQSCWKNWIEAFE